MTNDLEVRVVLASRYRNDQRWNYQGTMLPHNTVYFVTGGDGHIRLNGVTTDMLPGYAYLIPLRLRHDIWCDTYVEKVYMNVHAELLPGYDVFSDTRKILSQPVGMEKCMRISELCNDSVRNRLAVRGELMLALAGFLEKEPAPVPAKIASILPIVTDIQQNLSAQIRREDVAARFGWNPAVLTRTFQQVFGCSFKAYVQKLLVARLSEELLLTQKTLQQLSGEFGFCDAYYLSAFFKRSIGLSPADYRRIRRQQDGQ